MTGWRAIQDAAALQQLGLPGLTYLTTEDDDERALIVALGQEISAQMQEAYRRGRH